MGNPYEITKMPQSHEAACPCVPLGVVRVYGPSDVQRKSPKFLDHMRLPSSSRAPYKSKTRESVGNPTTYRASPQDFFEDVSTRMGAIEPVAESWVCTTFRHGIPTSVGPHKAPRRPYGVVQVPDRDTGL